MEKYNHAIVRRPCPEMIHGLTRAQLGLPQYEKAVQQHEQYIDTLKRCGLDIILLEADNRYPDSTFVEDTVVLTPRCAIITRPGAPSRRGEIRDMKKVVNQYFKDIRKIYSPGTLDAGDVLEADGHYFIGISARTNRAGAQQLQSLVGEFGYGSSLILLNNLLHLKSGVSSLENNRLVIIESLAAYEDFRKYDLIVVNDREQYAANCLWINGFVLVADGFPETRRNIEEAGFKVIPLDVSEFQKLDGGLSCLSVRF
jgi:dimethylargininase